KFFVVRPHADRAEVLSDVQLPPSKDDNAGQSAGIPEPVFGGAAISRGRIFFVSTGGVYAIGAKTAKAVTGLAVDAPPEKGDGAAPAGWVNAVAGKFSVTTLDGQKVLQKAPDATIFKRIRAFIGPVDFSNYTFEADVRGTTKRRQMTDVGITAQRYSLVLYG